MLTPYVSPPPQAPRRPYEHVAHGDTRRDDWQWLAERDSSEVLSYLEAENDYADAVLAPLAPLQDKLFDQLKNRLAETDVSTPVFYRGWWYWSRAQEGQQYAVHCRRPDPGHKLTTAQVLAAARAALPGAGVAGDGTPPPQPGVGVTGDGAAPPLAGGTDAVPREAGLGALAEEAVAGEVVLDENALAGDSEYFALGIFDIRPDHEVLAYAVDYDGSERHTLRFRDLDTGHDLVDVVKDVYYSSAWSGSCKSFFYVRLDKAMRPWQVWRHDLGTPAGRDELVYQEDDERFFVSVGLTRSRRFVLISSESKTTTEVRYLRADKDRHASSVLFPRRDGVEYDVDHIMAPTGGRTHQDRWLVRSNRGPGGEVLENFGLFELPVGDDDFSRAQEFLPYRGDVKVEAVEPFARFVLVLERQDGLAQLRVVRLEGRQEHAVAQPEATYALSGDNSMDWDSDVARFSYSSLVTPPSSIEYDMAARQRVTVKRSTVGGGYRPEDYRSERLWAPAPDGTLVPISLVCRRDQALDGTAPCLLYGYGSYEITIDPSFSHTRLSLLERGFVFAIAHIRGGGEMGRYWYEEGRLGKKRTTFSDFIACAEYLVAQGWTSPGRLVARGGSAGGLLMGAVTNMRSDLFRAIVAEVPFVDVVTTMTDESLPLTVTEWEEWGNPRDNPEAYAYMKSYSPYDNVVPGPYPWMYVTAGLNDPRVAYWEPAKWVAKLRATKTDENPLLLKTEMGAGHGGPSGRYDAWRDEARAQSFILSAVGLSE